MFHKLLIKYQVGGLSATQPLRSLSYRSFLQQDLFLGFYFASLGRILVFFVEVLRPPFFFFHFSLFSS